MSIEKHPTRSGWYYVKHYPNGRKQPPERVPVEGFAAASTLDNRLKAAKANNHTIPAAMPRLKDITEDYLEWVKKNLRPATQRNKNERLNKFIIPQLGNFRAQDLSQRLLDQYGKSHTQSMLRCDIIHIMALIKWMVKRQYAAPLTWKPEIPPANSKIKNLPEPAQLFETIDAIPYESVRMLFTLQLFTGLRPGEVKNLRWENYRHDCIILTTTKTKEPQIIPIPDHLQPWFISHEKTTGWIFPSTWRKNRPWSNLHGILTDASKKTGCYLTPHLIRHCSATFLLDATDDIYQVSQHLRHSRVTTTEIYLRYSAKRKRAAVQSIHDYIESKKD